MLESELKYRKLFPIVTLQGNGFIDKTGQIAIEPQFDWVGSFSDGLAAVVIEEQIGYINNTGTSVIEPKFNYDEEIDGFEYFSEGLAVTSFLNKTLNCFQKGYINKNGEIAIAPQFEQAYPFREGIARVKLLNQNSLSSSFITQTGEILFTHPNAKEARDFCEGLAAVKIGSKWGYIDRSGRITIKPQFMGAQDFSEGLAAVIDVRGKWGYIDKSGYFVVPPRFNPVIEFTTPPSKFSEGLAAVGGEDGTRRWGYINKKGEFAIEPKFDSGYAGCSYFSEGLAWVTVGCEPEKRELNTGKYGYINKEGKWAIEPKFDFATDFCDGLAKVQIDDYSSFERGKWGYINKYGEFVWQWMYC